MNRPLRTLRGACVAALALATLAGAWSLLPVAPSPRAAWAQAGQGQDEEAQKREMERLRREAAEKRKKAQELKARETKVLKELRATEKKLRTTRTNIKQLSRREIELERELASVRADLSRSRAALADQRERLAQRLRSQYKYGRAREIEFFLSAESFAQLLVRYDFITRVSRQDRRILLGITKEKERIEADETRLDATHDEVDRTLSKKEKEQKELDRLARQKKQSVSKIQNERKEYEAAAAELERTARRIQTLLAELERKRREEEEARRRAAAGPGGTGGTGGTTGRPAPPPMPYEGDFERGRGQLDWPLRGEIVGRFGNEKHPRFGTVTFNNGIDIKAAVGSPVRAVAKGRVDFTSDDYGSYGQMIILNHGSGYYTLYAHLSDISVSRNQEVSAGQVIGRAGDSGSLKGPILHFEVRKGRQALDPMGWLR